MSDWDRLIREWLNDDFVGAILAIGSALGITQETAPADERDPEPHWESM